MRALSGMSIDYLLLRSRESTRDSVWASIGGSVVAPCHQHNRPGSPAPPSRRRLCRLCRPELNLCPPSRPGQHLDHGHLHLHQSSDCGLLSLSRIEYSRHLVHRNLPLYQLGDNGSLKHEPVRLAQQQRQRQLRLQLSEPSLKPSAKLLLLPILMLYDPHNYLSQPMLEFRVHDLLPLLSLLNLQHSPARPEHPQHQHKQAHLRRKRKRKPKLPHARQRRQPRQPCLGQQGLLNRSCQTSTSASATTSKVRLRVVRAQAQI